VQKLLNCANHKITGEVFLLSRQDTNYIVLLCKVINLHGYHLTLKINLRINKLTWMGVEGGFVWGPEGTQAEQSRRVGRLRAAPKPPHRLQPNQHFFHQQRGRGSLNFQGHRPFR
jgi:hypothetical protein